MRAHICMHCGEAGQINTVCAFDGARIVEDRAGELIDARYRLRRPLGRGGMGSVVWTAEQLDTGREVALKLLADRDPDANARFKRGAIIASHLNHPGITTVYGQGRHTDGSLFLVMQRLQGEDLRAMLARGPLPPERVIRLIDQLLAALAHMHARHMMHLDIKPANLFAARHGEDEYLKLLDFDITNVTDAACPKLMARLPVPSVRQICGTPQYMAPESLRGEVVDTRADLYAVGVVMYELLSGQLPFRGHTPGALLRAHQAGQPRVAPLRHLRPRLTAVVMRALRDRPQVRFEDALAMRRALRETERSTGSLLPLTPRIATPQAAERPNPIGSATQPCRPSVASLRR